MSDKKPVKNWWWPKLSDRESAIEATKTGFRAAIVVAVVTAIYATVAPLTKKEIASINAWAYLDTVLFGVIAWRIKCYSRAFAVAGVLLFIAEKIMLAQTLGTAGWPMAVFLLLMFITGARGTFAYHKFSSTQQPEISRNNFV